MWGCKFRKDRIFFFLDMDMARTSLESHLANSPRQVDNMSGPQLMSAYRDTKQQLKDAEYSHGNQRTSYSEEALLLATQHIGKLNKFFQVLKAQVDKNEAEQTKGAADKLLSFCPHWAGLTENC